MTEFDKPIYSRYEDDECTMIISQGMTDNVLVFECSKCSKKIYESDYGCGFETPSYCSRCGRKVTSLKGGFK